MGDSARKKWPTTTTKLEREVDAQTQTIVELMERAEKAEAALVRYGEHETGCAKGDACDCGLLAALGAALSSQGGS